MASIKRTKREFKKRFLKTWGYKPKVRTLIEYQIIDNKMYIGLEMKDIISEKLFWYGQWRTKMRYWDKCKYRR